MEKKDLLKQTIEHIDIKKINSTELIDAMRGMSFSSRDTANAADIFQRMVNDKDCSIILTLAGSTSAAGCMQVYVDMVKNKMVDCIVSTGASIIDMDFFEALGFKHYKGTPFIDDKYLRSNYVDRIYDTYIDEEELQNCDATIKMVADSLEPRPYSSREFIWELGKWLANGGAKKKDSLIQACYENNVPIFCPAFSDCSAGFGLVMHQVANPDKHLSIDSVKDFLEYQNQSRYDRFIHGRWRHSEELCTGYGRLCRSFGTRGGYAQICSADNRCRCERRSLLVFDLERSLLMGKSRYDL